MVGVNGRTKRGKGYGGLAEVEARGWCSRGLEIGAKRDGRRLRGAPDSGFHRDVTA